MLRSKHAHVQEGKSLHQKKASESSEYSFDIRLGALDAKTQTRHTQGLGASIEVRPQPGSTTAEKDESYRRTVQQYGYQPQVQPRGSRDALNSN